MKKPTAPDLAPLLESFFVQRLVRERQASPHTIASYRDAFRLLLHFAAARRRRPASDLTVADLDTTLVSAFLDHLETDRGSTARTRNARLSAFHSFFRFVALNEPASGTLAQRVLAIPSKRTQRPLVSFLAPDEIVALLNAPNLNAWSGRRDRALLLLAVQAGLRVSELAGLCVQDVALGPSAHVRCVGKGRRDRCTPLRRDVERILRGWLHERQAKPGDPVFPNARGLPITRDGIAYVLAKHVTVARRSCPTLARKRVTPHVLRHTAAMTLLQNGVDRSVIALWLGHESIETTEMYLHADMKMKEQALARTSSVRARGVRYRPADRLLAFLESL